MVGSEGGVEQRVNARAKKRRDEVEKNNGTRVILFDSRRRVRQKKASSPFYRLSFLERNDVCLLMLSAKGKGQERKEKARKSCFCSRSRVCRVERGGSGICFFLSKETKQTLVLGLFGALREEGARDSRWRRCLCLCVSLAAVSALDQNAWPQRRAGAGEFFHHRLLPMPPSGINDEGGDDDNGGASIDSSKRPQPSPASKKERNEV